MTEIAGRGERDDLRRVLRRAAQRPVQAPVHDIHDTCERRGKYRHDNEQGHERGAELGVDIVEIGAGHERPSPWHVGGNVTALGHLFLRARAKPDIVDEAVAGRTRHFGDLAIHVGSVGVLEIAEVLAFRFRLERIHHRVGVVIDDRHVPVCAITEGAQRGECLFLRFVQRERAARGQGGVSLCDAHGDIARVLERVFTFVDTRLTRLPRPERSDTNDTEQRQH